MGSNNEEREWKEMQFLLQGELQRMSEKLSKDLRHEVSTVLSQWLSSTPPERKRIPRKPTEEEMPVQRDGTFQSQKDEAPQLQPSPTLSVAGVASTPLTDERDFARMRMKARTYVGTDGILAPVPTGSMTMIGTPKSQPGGKAGNFGFSRSQSMATLDVSPTETIEEVEEKGPEQHDEKPAEGKQGKKNSRALREPRSIFVHHTNLYAAEHTGSEEAEEDSKDGSSGPSRCNLQKKCQWLVSLEVFDYVMGLAIFANAILMGVQADLAVQSARTGAVEPPAVRALAVILGVIFTVELVLRIFAFRLDFFTKPGWKWNVFDFVLVFLQISEEVVTAVVYTDNGSRSVNLSFMRILRVLRLVRIVRLVRVLRLIRELRTLVQSIASTMTSLLWTVVLLLLLIFVVGICFTQVIADVAEGEPQVLREGTDTFEFYGSLMRSVMSLYQSITSGVSWRDASLPLERHSGIMGLVFAVYIAFAALAMLNVITGVFVESAMASAREENTVTVVSRMREIVDRMDVGESGQMTWEQFEGQLDNPVMEAYFKSIDLSVTEARSLFLLLDIDEQGFIDVEEFIAGCCRIHGPAKAIDLTTLMCQVRKLHMELREHALWVVECLSSAGFATPVSAYAGSPRRGRRPSFGLSLTSQPQNALKETKEIREGTVHFEDSPLKAKNQETPGTTASSPAKLLLPINRVEDDAFANVTEWAKNKEKKGRQPLSL